MASALWDWLAEPAAEHSAEFLAEVRRLARRGLLIAGAVQISMPIAGRLVWAALPGKTPLFPMWVFWSFLALGALTVLSARIDRAGRFSRTAFLLTGVATLTLLVAGDLSLQPSPQDLAIRFLMNLTTVTFVGVAAAPLLPWQVLLLGGSGVLALLVLAGGRADLSFVLAGSTTHLLLASVLAGVSYRRLWKAFLRQQETLQAQSRLLLSEYSATLSKVAAALSHEMNSPLGALRSVAASMPALLERYAGASPSRQAELLATGRELCRTAADSAARLADMVARLRRLSNLDRAEVQPVDLNALLRDVAALVEAARPGVPPVDLHLAPLPPVSGRPQELSAVFTALLHHALEATPAPARVVVSAGSRNAHVEVSVHDSGPLSPEEAQAVFNPHFMVAANRVRANWSLLTCRQIVLAHGGDIQVKGSPSGKTVTVRLPRDSAAPRELLASA
jgi:signal transduction histidine kinase